MKRLLILAFLLVPAAQADERILNFQSDIIVMEDGWLDVTETITVRAEGNRIRRGIYRDFPTEYFDKFGNRYEVDFEPRSVLRNSAPEDFHSQSIQNGRRVYFGNADRFIETGNHTYEFHYKASRMLGFFETHDELYWNVTGFDWAFPIDHASASVVLAFNPSVSEISAEAYTGPFGATEKNYRSSIDGTGQVQFEATQPLSAVNGLTIVVGWPKGFVSEPTGMQKFGWLLKDNINLLIALAGFTALLIYYIPVWQHFGKDPEEGVIVTRYVPPDRFSPASLRYIRQMYYDDKVMTAGIVNLAVKGYLRINVTPGSQGFLGFNKTEAEHSLTKTDPGASPPPLAAGENELYDALFRGGDTVILKNENHGLLGKAKSAHRESLKADYKQKYFRSNGALNIPAVFIVIGTTIATLKAGPSTLVIVTIVTMIVTMVFFAIIMKRPTLRGRQLLDQMLGFKDYLEIAEKDEMNLRNPPEKTPELFESYLPYALALGVDQQWAERFAGLLESIRNPDGGAYRPRWYNGSWNSFDMSSTTKSLSSGLNSAISSSVTPPGSSSGGGGGGSSGGGGGGGGGGGW
jgi:uncharacterized membrane protein YgcG